MDVARAEDYCQEAVPSATSSYVDPRAHALRERYVRLFGGEEIPVPVERQTRDRSKKKSGLKARGPHPRTRSVAGGR